MRMPSDARTVTPIGARIAGAIALVALLSLGLRCALVLGAAEGGAHAAATARFFGDFTILSNVLVLGVALAATLAPEGEGLWSRAATRGLAASCIGVTLAIHDRILGPLSNPQGLPLWADIGLHYLVPMGYLTWWLWWAPHGGLQWRVLPKWLLFPVAYLVFAMVRGTYAHAWPYPFLDVDALGAKLAARNIAGVLLLFLAMGAAIVSVDRLLAPPRAAPVP